MKLSLRFLMYWIAILSILFVQHTTAEARQEETIKLPDCDKNAFEIRYLPNTNILYLKVNQDCEQLIKLFSDELQKPEYAFNNVAGYVFDLQGSKLSNRVDVLAELTSIFLADSSLKEKFYKRQPTYQGQRIFYQSTNVNIASLEGITSFNTKPLALLTGDATNEAEDNIILRLIGEARSIVLMGADIKGGFWTNDAPVTATFTNEISKYFMASNPVTSYSNIPNKTYLKFLDNLGSCSGNELKSWIIAISREVSSHAVYPPMAYWGGIEGSGAINVEVLSNGDVANVKVSISTGNNFLDQAMLDAVKTSKIQPLSCLKATKDNSHGVTVPFNFKLQSEK